MNEDPNVFNLDEYRKKPRKMTAEEMAARIGGPVPESVTPPPTHKPIFTPEKHTSTQDAPPEFDPLDGREGYFIPTHHATNEADNLHKHSKPSFSLEHIIKNLEQSEKGGAISTDAARGFAGEDDFLLRVMTTRLALTNALKTGERIHPKDERLLEVLSHHLFSLWDAMEQLEKDSATRRRGFLERIKEGLSGIVTTGTRRNVLHAMRQIEQLYRAIEEYENRFLIR